jgi:hypothetical protein
MECKLIFGMIWCGVKEEMEEIIIEHLMTIFAIYNNGKSRKGKYKRIKRSEKFNKLINYFTEKKDLGKYDTVIEARKESIRKNNEESRRFIRNARKEEYFKRRKSELRLILPDLSNNNYIENNEKAQEKKEIMKRELIPKQNYNINRRRKRERIFNIGIKNKGWRYKEAQKRKKFKEKSIENVKESYQENTKRRSQGTSSSLLSRGSSKKRSQGKSLILLSKMPSKRKIKIIGNIQKTQRKEQEKKTCWEPKVRA